MLIGVNDRAPRTAPRMRFNLALDSGAFSLFNQFFSKGGAKATGNKNRSYAFRDSPQFKTYLEKYIRFLKQHWIDFRFDFYVTIDILDHVEMTLALMEEIESHGLTPMPVYHFGEPLSVFKRYADKYEYIGLGGAAPSRAAGLVPFVDPVFEYLCGKGFKKPSPVRIHALGMTSIPFMARYPIHSFDSTSWLQQSRTGAVLLPRTDHKGERKWFHSFISMPITDRRVKGSRHHLKHIAPVMYRIFEQWIEECGFSIEELQEEHNGNRSLANLVYWFRVQTELGKKYERDFNYHGGANVYVSGSPRNLGGSTPADYEKGLRRAAVAAGITEVNYLGTYFYQNDLLPLIEVHRQWA